MSAIESNFAQLLTPLTFTGSVKTNTTRLELQSPRLPDCTGITSH